MALSPETLGKNLESKNLLEKLNDGDYKIMEKLGEFWEKLKTSELGGMVGGVLAMMKEWFEKDDDKQKPEKTDPVKESQIAQQEVKTKVTTQQNLNSLKANLEKKDTPVEKLEKPDGRGMVFVGDSMMHGFQLKYPKAMRPKFIGKDGNPSYVTLAQVREQRREFRGAREVRIYTGGNNVGYTSPQDIVSHMKEMVSIAKQEGVDKVVICTRFPMDPHRKKALGGEIPYKNRQDKNLALQQELLRAYRAGEFPQGTQLVDLFERFRIGGSGPDANELQPQYQGKDPIHPGEAYIPALNEIDRQTSKAQSSPRTSDQKVS